jgi:2-thiouridine synthetase TtuA, N-terminal LIM domain
MRCDKCGNKAVFFQSYSGRHLCGRHLVLDIEARAKRSIRSYRWMRPGDQIGVIISGDRKSAALLHFMQKLTGNRRDIRLSAVPAYHEKGGTGGRSAAMTARELLRISRCEMPLPNGSGHADRSAITTVAVAVTLDDIAQCVLEQFLFGNADHLVVHHSPSENGLPRVICPFIAIPEDELDIYWDIEGSGIGLPPGILTRENIAQIPEPLFKDFYQRHPATKFALLHLAEELTGGNVSGIAVARSTVGDVSPSHNVLRGGDGNGS